MTKFKDYVVKYSIIDEIDNILEDNSVLMEELLKDEKIGESWFSPTKDSNTIFKNILNKIKKSPNDLSLVYRVKDIIANELKNTKDSKTKKALLKALTKIKDLVNNGSYEELKKDNLIKTIEVLTYL